jgi:hypothetical protein
LPAVLVGVVAFLAVLLPASAAAANGPPPGHVLLIGVPDLRWSDVAHMPMLARLAGTSSVANLSVRSSGDATRCGDGLFELSAGTRVPSGVVACPPSLEDVGRLAYRYRFAPFAPRVGALGLALPTAVPLDRAAALVLSSPTAVPMFAPTIPPGADVAVAVDTALYGVRRAERRARLAALDAQIDRQRRDAGPDATVLVAGISDGAAGPAHLHALIVSGPGWGPGELRSASTGRAGYVQLVDVTATLIEQTVGLPLPVGMIGRPVELVGGSHRSLATLVDDDRHARAAADVSGGTRNVLALVLSATLLLLFAGRREAWLLARLAAAAPALTFVVQLLPWWRWGTAAYAGLVVAGSVMVGAAVTAIERRGRWWALIAVPLLTAVVFAVDQLAGAPLDLSAPMGDNPLVAGRFHGMGNMAFGLFAASALFCAGVVASRRTKVSARVGLVAGIGIVALVIDAAPQLGDDLGGLLALLPGVVLLAALVAGVRITWRRAIVVAGITLLAAAAIGVLDAARGPHRRTHIGQFVADLADGRIDPVVDRKWRAMLRSFGNVALDVLVALTAATVVTARRRLPRLAARVETDAGLRAALLAGAVVGVLGTLLNDSGVVVAAGAAFAVVPAVVGDTRTSGAE